MLHKLMCQHNLKRKLYFAAPSEFQCENEGKCSIEYLPNGETSEHKCQCLYGFAGDRCENSGN